MKDGLTQERVGERPVALVTGASSGIGEAFARRLARDGYDLVLVARRKPRLDALAEELRRSSGAEVTALQADLADPAQLRLVEEKIRSTGRLERLINNAGFMRPEKFLKTDVGVWDQMVRLHVLATTRLTYAALPQMISRGRGDVIHVASIAAFFPVSDNVVYSATKEFLSMFTEGLFQELHGTGVRLQVLCPGWTRTELVASADVDTSRIPRGGWMEPEDVVDYSLRCLRRGKLISIPGWRNRLLVRTARWSIRPILRWVLRNFRSNQVMMKGD
jgi:uncharacterized protein